MRRSLGSRPRTPVVVPHSKAWGVFDDSQQHGKVRWALHAPQVPASVTSVPPTVATPALVDDMAPHSRRRCSRAAIRYNRTTLCAVVLCCLATAAHVAGSHDGSATERVPYHAGAEPNCTQAEIVSSQQCGAVVFLDDERSSTGSFELHHNRANDTLSIRRRRQQLAVFTANTTWLNQHTVVRDSVDVGATLVVAGTDVLAEIARVEAFAANLTAALLRLGRELRVLHQNVHFLDGAAVHGQLDVQGDSQLIGDVFARGVVESFEGFRTDGSVTLTGTGGVDVRGVGGVRLARGNLTCGGGMVVNESASFGASVDVAWGVTTQFLDVVGNSTLNGRLHVDTPLNADSATGAAAIRTHGGLAVAMDAFVGGSVSAGGEVAAGSIVCEGGAVLLAGASHTSPGRLTVSEGATPQDVAVSVGAAPATVIGGHLSLQAGAGNGQAGGSVQVVGGDGTTGGSVRLMPGQGVGVGGTVMYSSETPRVALSTMQHTGWVVAGVATMDHTFASSAQLSASGLAWASTSGGDAEYTTSSDVNTDTGGATFSTGDAGTATSGDVRLHTGAGGTSGDVVINTGSATGTAGAIRLQRQGAAVLTADAGGVSVGGDGAGLAVTLYGASAGEKVAWDADSAQLSVVGRTGTTALHVEGDAVVRGSVTADSISVSPGGNITLAAGTGVGNVLRVNFYNSSDAPACELGDVRVDSTHALCWCDGEGAWRCLSQYVAWGSGGRP